MIFTNWVSSLFFFFFCIWLLAYLCILYLLLPRICQKQLCFSVSRTINTYIYIFLKVFSDHLLYLRSHIILFCYLQRSLKMFMEICKLKWKKVTLHFFLHSYNHNLLYSKVCTLFFSITYTVFILIVTVGFKSHLFLVETGQCSLLLQLHNLVISTNCLELRGYIYIFFIGSNHLDYCSCITLQFIGR